MQTEAVEAGDVGGGDSLRASQVNWRLDSSGSFAVALPAQEKSDRACSFRRSLCGIKRWRERCGVLSLVMHGQGRGSNLDYARIALG